MESEEEKEYTIILLKLLVIGNNPVDDFYMLALYVIVAQETGQVSFPDTSSSIIF